MAMSAHPPSAQAGLEQHGLFNLNDIYWTLPTAALYEQAIQRHEGNIAHMGVLVVRTGHHTGRSANDKFVVREPSTEKEIWWSEVNRPYDAERFERLHQRMASYLQMKDVFVQDCFVGTDPDYRLPIRVITEYAWHSLFARNMFIQAQPGELAGHQPQFTVIDAPRFHAVPETDGTHSETFIVINFAKRLVLIGGTSYAGEIKKSIFTVMNYLLPQRGVLPMHSSANIGPDGATAIFFGLSGTGKTTLSADSSRTLIGDDEHGWSDNGVFNLEGGCYAKTLRLSPVAEPEIFSTTRRFGTILENVTVDAHSRQVNLDDDSLTENTRASYHVSAIRNATLNGYGGHPRNILFLAADAFGVLPPVASLTPEQAMYHFISGYTARVAGTEKGVTEPVPVFSPCYGGPFLPLHPRRYAEMLGSRIRKHGVRVWLINTGWIGGAVGTGSRMSIAHTRAIVNAVLAGRLDGVPSRRHPVFGLSMPIACPGVPAEVLDPRNAWTDKAAYDAAARRIAALFRENFAKYEQDVPEEVRAAAPAAA
ncbi:MAG: phosphoenolpyruvate carboxykinase (ATP) [Rhodocyclaceae bacterium]